LGALDPLGAQRRCVREREDVLGGDGNVRVIGKSRVPQRTRRGVDERDGLRNDRDRAGATALAEARALVAAVGVRVGGAVVLGMPGRCRGCSM